MLRVEYQFRPISTWPGAMKSSRKRATFKATYNATIQQLHRELNHLRASKVVIEVALDERDIRNDGLPRSDARPRHPGVILSFSTPAGPLRFPCDTYTVWQDNLRAIALALEALRRVDRYGVTRKGEQYTGWKQLPGGTVEPAMDLKTAATVLSNWTKFTPGEVYHSLDHYRNAYREAAKLMHPDLTGGDDKNFKLLQEAKRVLDQHHGL